MNTCEWEARPTEPGGCLELVAAYRTNCGGKTIAAAGKDMEGTQCPLCLRKIHVTRKDSKE